MKSDKYGERRGAAFGLAGVVKGFGISCLKKHGIAATLREGLADRYIFSLVWDSVHCSPISQGIVCYTNKFP